MTTEQISKENGEKTEADHTIDTLFGPLPYKAFEEITVNLIKASLMAQSAMTTAAMANKKDGFKISDPFDVNPVFQSLTQSWARNPETLFKAQFDLFSGYLDIWQKSVEKSLSHQHSSNKDAPSVLLTQTDKRFKDPAWTENPLFEIIKDSYLLQTSWLRKLIYSTPDLEEDDRARLDFMMKILTDAFSPSNFLMSNPVALKTMIETKGESLVKGMEQFAKDIMRGDGKLLISQADYQKFEVGRNLATTPGKVIYRSTLFELINYNPTTSKVYQTPLLIFPPWINKYYILDLQKKNSMISWLVDQGFNVFLVSWVNPDQTHKDLDFEDYLFSGLFEAIETTRTHTKSEKVNCVGYCIGGTLLGCGLAYMAAKNDKRVESATFFTAQHDFSQSGDLKLFTTEYWLQDIETRMNQAGGILPGSDMADTFNILRANDLIWSFYINNYLMGKEPAPFDLLCWNSDHTRLIKNAHLFYLRQFYMNNALVKNQLSLGSEILDLSTVTLPLYFQAGAEDHIAPAASVYFGTQFYKNAKVRFILAGSGHIAGVVNHPDAKKYQYWTNEGTYETLADWRHDAKEIAGSWWPDWKEWLCEKSGELIDVSDRESVLAAVCDAPGLYVTVK